MEPLDSFRKPPPTFTPAEQEAILSAAARLQSESSQNCTLEDLERAAMESGIDPRFVREAARRQVGNSGGMPVTVVSSALEIDRRAAGQALASLVTYIPMQMALTSSLIRYASPYSGGLETHLTVFVALSLCIAAILGLAMPRGAQWRLPTALASLGGTIVAAVFFRLTHGWFFFYGYGLLSLIVAMQGAVAFGIHALRDRRRLEFRQPHV